MSTTEVVKPEIVGGPDPEAEWDAPCPVCQAHWGAGPERETWGRQHCWQCGYTPGGATPPPPGIPNQPDWARLVNEAVRQALASEPQLLAEARTAALGREGMASLAAEEQARFTGGTAPGPAEPGA